MPHLRTATPLLMLLLLVAVVVCGVPRSDPAGAAPAANVRFVAPGGTSDGTTAARPAGITSLPELLSALPHGGEIRLQPGSYDVRKPITLGGAGARSARVVIRGADAAGVAGRATIVGQRPSPYHATTAVAGRPVFVLQSGADALSFQDIDFSNVGNTCIAVRNPVRDLELTDLTARNVRRFFDVEATGAATGLRVRRVQVLGYSKGALRLQGDTSDVLVEDVLGDSEGQDGDDFAMGVHLLPPVRGVTLRRVVMRNHVDTLSAYRNGDGFVAERGVRDIRFELTEADGNMDAGYDVKADAVSFAYATATGNKRNFRLWGRDVLVWRSRSTDPVRRGGQGSEAHVWVAPGASVRLVDSVLSGGTVATVPLDAGLGAEIVVEQVGGLTRP